MDVKNLDLGGSWVTLKAVNEKVGELKFRVKPIDTTLEIEIEKLISADKDKELANKIGDIILDWDLLEDGKKLNCNQENKAKYLPYLVRLPVEPYDPENKILSEPNKGYLGTQLLAYASDIGNFVKN